MVKQYTISAIAAITTKMASIPCPISLNDDIKSALLKFISVSSPIYFNIWGMRLSIIPPAKTDAI